jgi:hypothetical protein
LMTHRAGDLFSGDVASERQGPERPEGAREDRPGACPACSERPEGANPRGSRYTPVEPPCSYLPDPPASGPCILRRLWGSVELLPGGRGHETAKSGDRV